MTLEEKYRIAVEALKEIARYETDSRGLKLEGMLDASSTMSRKAVNALREIEEP